MCPEEEEDRSLAVLHVVLISRANGGYAEGFKVPHGASFPSEEDKMLQTRIGQSFGMHRIRRGMWKKRVFSFSL